MSITIAQILDAVEATLSASTSLSKSMSFDELAEGINDTPSLQVYPESGDQDPTTNTDRTTFRAGVRQTSLVVNCDLYARQRKHIGEDMAILVTCLDDLIDIFEQQNTKPYFGLDGLKAFHYTWQRVTFQYGDPAINYVGVRFQLTLRIF